MARTPTHTHAQLLSWLNKELLPTVEAEDVSAWLESTQGEGLVALCKVAANNMPPSAGEARTAIACLFEANSSAMTAVCRTFSLAHRVAPGFSLEYQVSLMVIPGVCPFLDRQRWLASKQSPCAHSAYTFLPLPLSSRRRS